MRRFGTYWWVAVLLAVGAASSARAATTYRPCIEQPVFERPNFEKSERVLPMMDLPDYDPIKMEVYERAQSLMVKPEFVRPQFVPSDFEDCRTMMYGSDGGFGLSHRRFEMPENAYGSATNAAATMTNAPVKKVNTFAFVPAPKPNPEAPCCGQPAPEEQPAKPAATHRLVGAPLLPAAPAAVAQQTRPVQILR